MPLPSSIEIVPLRGPVRAAIRVPGSKSITNRALILAALAKGRTVLKGALWSDDTEVMVQALQKLGFAVEVGADTAEACNRTITVEGLEGRIPNAGSAQNPLELYVGNAGTAARFLAALVCLGNGSYRLHGSARMHQRPQQALFDALAQLGYRVQSSSGRLPAAIWGQGPVTGKCQVSIAESSQFASALLLVGARAGWEVTVTGENQDESPYVRMTAELVRTFPMQGANFEVEPDASSASYFHAAAHLICGTEPAGAGAACAVTVQPAASSDWQIDAAFPRFLPLPPQISRARDLGDSILTAMVLAPFSKRPVLFTDLGRLRVQECERVAAMRTELSRCGARVEEQGDTLVVFPSAERLHGAEIETYDDHRIALCFGILGLKVPGIKIKNPACVKKTFPDFFQKLAALPPAGLGTKILDGDTGSELQVENLFAD